MSEHHSHEVLEMYATNMGNSFTLPQVHPLSGIHLLYDKRNVEIKRTSVYKTQKSSSNLLHTASAYSRAGSSSLDFVVFCDSGSWRCFSSAFGVMCQANFVLLIASDFMHGCFLVSCSFRSLTLARAAKETRAGTTKFVFQTSHNLYAHRVCGMKNC